MHTRAVRRELNAGTALVCICGACQSRAALGLHMEHMCHICPWCQRDEVVPAPVVFPSGELVLHMVRVLGGQAECLGIDVDRRLLLVVWVEIDYDDERVGVPVFGEAAFRLPREGDDVLVGGRQDRQIVVARGGRVLRTDLVERREQFGDADSVCRRPVADLDLELLVRRLLLGIGALLVLDELVAVVDAPAGEPSAASTARMAWAATPPSRT